MTELSKIKRLVCLAITGAMKTTPMAAMEALLGLLFLQVMIEAEAQAGIYKLMCNQPWKPKSTNIGHTKKSQAVEYEPILQNASYRMLPRYAYHKPFTQTGQDQKGTGAGVCRWGSRRGHSFSLGLHTMVLQAEMYAIKACIMENTEMGYTGRNIYILSDSQTAIKALDSFQINSKFVSDCHQSLVKLSEHNGIQLVWVPGHMEIDGNEIDDELARQGSSHPFIGTDPALSIAAKVLRGVVSDWTSRKHEEHWQSIRRQKQAKGFLKKPSARKAGELLNLSRN
jgi:ribonuclease HI